MPNQLVYLDESGDAGFKLGQGSTPVLVLAAVIIETPADAEAVAECIQSYRVSLGKRKDFHFHFATLRADWRLGFCEAVSAAPFRFRAVVLKKAEVDAPETAGRSGDDWYNLVVGELFSRCTDRLEGARVFFDGEAGRESMRKMVTHLRHLCNTPDRRAIARIVAVPKRGNNALVQLADMVAGAIARSYCDEKKDHLACRLALGPCLEDVTEVVPEV